MEIFSLILFQKITQETTSKTKMMITMEYLMLQNLLVILIHKMPMHYLPTWTEMQFVTQLTMISMVTAYQTMKKLTQTVTRPIITTPTLMAMEYVMVQQHQMQAFVLLVQMLSRMTLQHGKILMMMDNRMKSLKELKLI